MIQKCGEFIVLHGDDELEIGYSPKPTMLATVAAISEKFIPGVFGPTGKFGVMLYNGKEYTSVSCFAKGINEAELTRILATN